MPIHAQDGEDLLAILPGSDINRVNFKPARHWPFRRMILRLNRQFAIFLVFIIIIAFTSPIDKGSEKAGALKSAGNRFLSIRNIDYGSMKDQRLDIYFPRDLNKKNTTIFYVHGGAWHGGDKGEANEWGLFFQKLGYTFISLNYRLTHTKEANIHPAQINDIDDAIDFVSKQAHHWGIDKKRFVIMGASAGAHLALLYAYKYNRKHEIKLAVSLCGVLDLTDKKMLSADVGDISGDTMVGWLIGDRKTSQKKDREAASPAKQIGRTTVPTFFIHGKDDEVIPYEQSVNAYATLQRLQIPSQLILLDNTHHDLLSRNMAKEFKTVDSFIMKHLR
jgi:acetyl esterase/lipase